MNNNYKLYWAHLPEHTDIMTQGYVGVAIDFEDRKRRHLEDAKKGDERTFYNAIRKYGNKIIWEVIGEGYFEKQAFLYEKFIRQNIRTGWNIAIGGKGGNTYIKTEEIKQKISLTLKSNYTEEMKDNLRTLRTGSKLSKETKEKISKSSKGRECKYETKKLISLSKIGDKNPNYGKTGTMLGKKHSEDAKNKMKKITNEERLFIKNSKLKQVELAKMFNVNRITIARIIKE